MLRPVTFNFYSLVDLLDLDSLPEVIFWLNLFHLQYATSVQASVLTGLRKRMVRNNCYIEQRHIECLVQYLYKSYILQIYKEKRPAV